MTLPPADDQNPNGRIQKPRGAERWALGVGLLILVALLGHLLNQQQASKQTADSGVEPVPKPSAADTKTAAETKTEAAQQSPTPRNPQTRKRSQAVYTVTHKHRLRDCHGTLTFTQEGLRFESDEPQDSFAVRLDEVTVEGDALRIRNNAWRFEFEDGVSAERIFQDWKTGTLRPASSR
jgi:hypothetical protein